MKILILSPLFPPDVGEPAQYVKDLATRLSTSHKVSLLVYGYLPESVPVTVTTVDKRDGLLKRVSSFYTQLVQLSQNTDMVIVNNGQSVELPFFVLSLFKSVPFVYCESDPIATKTTSAIASFLRNNLQQKATKIITLPETATHKKPEKLPFNTTSEATEYETWWKQHITEITTV